MWASDGRQATTYRVGIQPDDSRDGRDSIRAQHANSGSGDHTVTRQKPRGERRSLGVTHPRDKSLLVRTSFSAWSQRKRTMQSSAMNVRKIVVGIDGSEGSDAAVAWAIQEAGTTNAEIITVHVVMPPVPGAFVSAVAGDAFPRSDRQRLESLDAFAKKASGALSTSGIKYRILTRHGHPATEILRLADDEDADLIVVGNGLNSTMEEIFLGSVAHAVTHHANRPLVIVPSHVSASSIDTLGRKQRAEDAPAVIGPDPLMAAG